MAWRSAWSPATHAVSCSEVVVMRSSGAQTAPCGLFLSDHDAEVIDFYLGGH